MHKTESTRKSPLQTLLETIRPSVEMNDEQRTALSLLCKHGADINEPDGQGLTILLSSVKSGRIFASRAVLENGADINALTTNLESALHLCLANGECKYNYYFPLLDMGIT